MVLEDEAPQEEDVDGTPIVEDDEVVSIDATVSSTAMTPKLILIPAPVGASMRRQQAVKGHRTKDHPYELDFIPTIHGFYALPTGACSERGSNQSVSSRLSPHYMPGIGYASCQARNVAG